MPGQGPLPKLPSSSQQPDLRRLTWDEVWTAVAVTVGDRSLCVRDQVGAVIVDSTQRIVATGYNGPPAQFPHSEQPCAKWCKRALMAQQSESHGLTLDYTDCVSLHAEANALAVCDRRDREGGTIYVDSSVCWNCAKLIANSGLTRVVVITDRADEHRSPERSYEFLRSCGVEVVLT
jgi:deoxycytidylate deaminase